MVAHVPFSIYTLLTYHSTSFGILIFENEEKKKIIRSFVHQNSSLGAKIAHSSTKKVIKILSSQTKTTIINRKSIYCFKRLLEFHSRYQYPNNANESSPRITLKPSPKIQNPYPPSPRKKKKRNILVHPPFDRYEFGYESKFRLMKRSRCGPQRTTPQRRRRRRRRRRQRWRRRWRWPGER